MSGLRSLLTPVILAVRRIHADLPLTGAVFGVVLVTSFVFAAASGTATSTSDALGWPSRNGSATLSSRASGRRPATRRTRSAAPCTYSRVMSRVVPAGPGTPGASTAV